MECLNGLSRTLVCLFKWIELYQTWAHISDLSPYTENTNLLIEQETSCRGHVGICIVDIFHLAVYLF